MGGHDHGHHHHEPYKVPSPNIYKVEGVEELEYMREELAKRGLKDPWIRLVYTTRFKYNMPFKLINFLFLF